jgi:hypothetical protein
VLKRELRVRNLVERKHRCARSVVKQVESIDSLVVGQSRRRLKKKGVGEQQLAHLISTTDHIILSPIDDAEKRLVFDLYSLQRKQSQPIPQTSNFSAYHRVCIRRVTVESGHGSANILSLTVDIP